MKKIGLALSGGGARGFAHVGLLRLLEEMKINIEFISGVSAGAIIGALYAAGFSSVDILKLLKQNSYFGFKNIMWHGDGFFSMEPLLKLLQKNIPHNQFESLQKKLFITATDLQNNNSHVFSSGELSAAVIASASIPVVFAPYEVNNTKYVDGGLLNNLNVEVLQPNTDFIIGCHVNKLQTPLVNSKIQMIEHCFHLSISHKVYEQAKYCDIFIEPDLSKFKLFDSDKADEIVEIGYQSALQYKSGLEKIF